MRCAVTILASHGKTGSHVIGIACVSVVIHVTSRAGRLRAFEFPAHVAIGTLQRCMHSREGKSRALQVIEFGPEPSGDRVALLACCREACGCMAW